MCALAHLVHLQAGDRSDETFIRQLLRRNLFDVAERFCETRRTRSLNADEGSEWARRLADITAQQAWLQDSTSRNELLNRQIDQLESIFNTATPLTAESRLRTRFAQIRLIQTGLTIQQLLEHAGHLCSRQNGLPRETRSPRIETQTNSANSDETVELLDALLTEIDRDRSELGIASAELRDQGRLLKSTLHLLRAAKAKSFSKTANDELEQAMTIANAVVRATREVATKKHAYELIATCHLIADSISDLESHVRRLDTLYPDSTAKGYELLLVLSRLRHQDVDGAMLHLSDYTPTTAMDLQLVAWLRLEAALIRYETAVELQDADLTSEASTAFQTAAATTRQQTSGAYREAAERVVARFELTESVGVEVADLVELISVYRKQNKLATALGIIAAARQRLPAAAWRAKAALDLSAGEILISQSAYTNAQEKLTSAVEAYKKSNGQSSPVRRGSSENLRIRSNAY